MTTYILRASHANQFELQNYEPIASEFDIKVVTSRHSLTPITLPTIALWSPTDLPSFPYRRQIMNRLIGGEQWLVGLEKLIQAGDIVHTTETYTPYTQLVVALRKKGIITKLICTCWETIPHSNEKFGRFKRWKEEAYKYIDIFHTPTDRAKQALVTEGVVPAKIKVIPYGVDLGRFKPVKKKFRNRLLILTVARLEREKGMEIIESVASRLRQCDFLVVGKGSFKFRGENINTQEVPYTEIHHIYQKADIFFLPSLTTPTWEEQFGMALVEAMGCGLPVIASDSGAIPEIVSRAGLIVKRDDIPGYVAGIEEIVGDTSIRAKYSENSRKLALQKYDRITNAELLRGLYS